MGGPANCPRRGLSRPARRGGTARRAGEAGRTPQPPPHPATPALISENIISEAIKSAPRPKAAIAIMPANATSRPLAAITAVAMPYRAPTVIDRRLLGPNAMFRAKQAGMNMRMVSSAMTVIRKE